MALARSFNIPFETPITSKEERLAAIERLKQKYDSFAEELRDGLKAGGSFYRAVRSERISPYVEHSYDVTVDTAGAFYWEFQRVLKDLQMSPLPTYLRCFSSASSRPIREMLEFFGDKERKTEQKQVDPITAKAYFFHDNFDIDVVVLCDALLAWERNVVRDQVLVRRENVIFAKEPAIRNTQIALGLG